MGNKICTQCKWYPRSWFRRLFNLKPVFKRYAKCESVFVLTDHGALRYCEIERTYPIPISKCGPEGKYFEFWKDVDESSLR